MEDQKFYQMVGKARNSDSSENITFWDYMRKADQTKQVLDEIPIAEMATITKVTNDKGNDQIIQNPKKIKGIFLKEETGDRLVSTVSRHYKLVQHKEAFEPIFNALHTTATPYEFALFQTDTKAFLKVFVDEIGDNGKGIKLGFEAINSIDGRNAISYTLMSSELERRTKTVVEVVGLRLACKNGMKIRVPLSEAEEIKIEIRTEVRERIKELLKMATNIIHKGEDVKDKIKAVQYVTEAMALLKEPVAQIINKAKEREVGEQEAKQLIGKYIGKRLSERISNQFQEEEPSIWGLYNAITNVASHGVKVPTMNGLINKAADLLEQEITVVEKG